MIEECTSTNTSLQYDLKNPIKSYFLPKRYKEISGISFFSDKKSLAFVQDEAVQIYKFDLCSSEITEYSKLESGDLEDIEIIGIAAYLLKAGDHPSLYKICHFSSKKPHYERYNLNLHKSYDPEGLCSDVDQSRLLIACKGSPNKNDHVREVFTFNLQSGCMDDLPLLSIDCRDFLNSSKDRFNPSGIAMHPQTSDLYIISTKSVKMMVCYGLDGNFKGAWKFDEDQFIQPEGIAFTNSGDLVISSEGKKGNKARISVISYI